MLPLRLTHPIERLLLGITTLAFFGVIYWKAGEPAPYPHPGTTSALVRPS